MVMRIVCSDKEIDGDLVEAVLPSAESLSQLYVLYKLAYYEKYGIFPDRLYQSNVYAWLFKHRKDKFHALKVARYYRRRRSLQNDN